MLWYLDSYLLITIFFSSSGRKSITQSHFQKQLKHQQVSENWDYRACSWKSISSSFERQKKMSIFTAVMQTITYNLMKKRCRKEYFSRSLIFLPWHNCNFSGGRVGFFSAMSCFNHRYNHPHRFLEEWRLKTSFLFSRIHYLASLWAAIVIRSLVGTAASFVVSPCSTTPWFPKLMLQDTHLPTQTCSAAGGMWECPYEFS